MSTPCSSRWVAKQWRRVWTVTDLSSPAASTAWQQARCTERAVIGQDGSGPGNSQEARAGAAPVRAQDRQQLRREHDVAVAPALALADVDGHPGAVDVADLEPDGLGDAQAGGVDRGQQRAHLPVGDGGQQARDLVLGEDGGQGSALRGSGISAAASRSPRVVP